MSSSFQADVLVFGTLLYLEIRALQMGVR